jgi:multidrug efflux pump subunit AcrA (membrane-fusion protein)
MNTKIFTIIPALICFSFLLTECKGKTTENQSKQDPVKPKTSVQITYPNDTVKMNDEITLNAVATYLLKSDVKANTTGYIIRLNAKLADPVKRGQTIFELKTKEAQALGNTINKLDPTFQFSGTTSVVSPATGYVAMLNHQAGDYVQEGDVLASITDKSSFGFVLEVPYEYVQLLHSQKNLTVHLPDGRDLPGFVSKIMPSVDPAAQTQQVLVKLKTNENIPENLIASIPLVKNTATGIFVPKTAVLTDDTQSEFWVMRLVNDTTAVKTIVKKGIENADWVQLLSTNLSTKDRIVVSGNYGMNDTTFVSIQR